MRFTELLRNWARSADGVNTYHVLLTTHRDALPPDELMLSLSGLGSLHNLSCSTEPGDLAPLEAVQLIDIDRLLNGYVDIHNSQAVLQDMVWSFFRALLHALPPDASPPYVQFLDSALAAIGSSEQNPDRILDHYWMKRLLSPVSHADAVAHVWNDTQSLPALSRPLLDTPKLKTDGTPWLTAKLGMERATAVRLPREPET